MVTIMRFLNHLLIAVLAFVGADKPAKPLPEQQNLFAKPNLVAWCIVPFDSIQRGPKERVEMLKRLGITQVAYDWRDHHLPQWDEELGLYQANGIRLAGFWAPARHREILDLMKRHKITSQLWVDHSAIGGQPKGDTQAQRIDAAAKAFTPLAHQAKEYGCTLGLYNHGGWFGEPENLAAIAQRLKDDGHPNVGIVYNLHHAHDHLDRLPNALRQMLPHLLCINLNGMRKAGPKILPIAQGDDDLAILRTIRDSGYSGPIGILSHREDADAEQTLAENLAGLQKLLGKLPDPEAIKTYSK
jgi:sugar phosphate isomerase/epimerase